MRLALAAASITAAAALALGGAAPALAAPSEPGTPTSGTTTSIPTTDPAASGTALADAALPIALGGLGLAVLAGTGGYVVGRARRDQDEHRRDGETGAGRQDTEQDGGLAVPPPYCMWW